jgi:hypothetical protein
MPTRPVRSSVDAIAPFTVSADGLRNFLLGGMQGKFRYLNVGLGVILAFVGVKMLLSGERFEVHLPKIVSLGVIAFVITVAVVASLGADARDRRIGPRDPHDIDAVRVVNPDGVDPSRDRTVPGDQASPHGQ